MPVVLSESVRDNPRSTTSSGTQRARPPSWRPGRPDDPDADRPGPDAVLQGVAYAGAQREPGPRADTFGVTYVGIELVALDRELGPRSACTCRSPYPVRRPKRHSKSSVRNPAVATG